MHLAICDDDIAHRKHFERLMKRESDVRTAEATPLYIDSFGSEEALFYAPRQYDIIFLAVHNLPVTDLELAKKLRSLQVQVPIVIVRIPGREYPDTSELKDIYYISNPLNPSEIHQMISIAGVFSQNASHLYEIHGIYETKYLSEEMILYANVRDNGKYSLHLTDGTQLDCDMPLIDFYYMVLNDIAFADTGKNAIINLRYLEKILFSKLVLKGSVTLPVSLSQKGTLRKQLSAFRDRPDE